MLLAQQLITGTGRGILPTVCILFISLLLVNFTLFCCSQKHVYPPQRRLLEIPWGKGDLKKQFIKDSLKLSWNFQRAGIGFINTKNNKFTETFLSFL